MKGEEYRKDFFNAFRKNFRGAENYLQVADPVKGGYLVPEEFHEEIISELKNENVLRQISRMITTATTHKIPIVSAAPAAEYVSEGGSINLSGETFAQKTLGAYKLAVAASLTNELLSDSFFDIEAHLTQEFAAAIGAREEQAFLTGTGSGEPLGLVTQMAADSSTTITTAGSGQLNPDDLMNLVYSLKRPYRKNAVFLLNDNTLAAIRKFKDTTLNYLWQPQLSVEEPPRLLGFPVYTSEFVPTIASGKIAVLFGDFTRFFIGERGEMQFKPLYELNALKDMTTYLLICRSDCCLADTAAIRGLKIA